MTMKLTIILLIAVVSNALQSVSDKRLTLNAEPNVKVCSRHRIELSGSNVFDLYLQYENDSQVRKNSNCTFFGDFFGDKYMVQILSADVVPYQSSLEIMDGYPVGRRMLREFNPHWSRQLFVSESDKIQVIFTTQEDYPEDSNSVGYRIRLTRFTGCPPDWNHLGDYCFTKSSASFLGNAKGVAMSHPEADYETAQAVCNRMRANLVVASDSVLKQSGISDLDRLMQNLSISNATWIGLCTEFSDQVSLIWLDGNIYRKDAVSCDSDSRLTFSQCQSTERFTYWTPRMLFLGQPIKERQFACFAIANFDDFKPLSSKCRPIGETPPASITVLGLSVNVWIYILVASILLVAVLAFSTISTLLVARHAQRGNDNPVENPPIGYLEVRGPRVFEEPSLPPSVTGDIHQ